MTFPFEIFPTLAGNVGGSTRVSSGRVRCPDGAGFSVKNSSQFGRMNRSMVIATRRHGSPTGYGSFFGVKSEGKASFDINNFFPFNSLRRERIYDSHSFISDFESRALNNAINEENNRHRNNDGKKKFPEIGRNNGLDQRSRNQKVTDKGDSYCGFRTKDFFIRQSCTPTCQVKLHD